MFSGFLIEQGFINSKVDTSLFTVKNDGGITLILVYVDEILIIGSNSSYISKLISTLS